MYNVVNKGFRVVHLDSIRSDGGTMRTGVKTKKVGGTAAAMKTGMARTKTRTARTKKVKVVETRTNRGRIP